MPNARHIRLVTECTEFSMQGIRLPLTLPFVTRRKNNSISLPDTFQARFKSAGHRPLFSGVSARKHGVCLGCYTVCGFAKHGDQGFTTTLFSGRSPLTKSVAILASGLRNKQPLRISTTQPSDNKGVSEFLCKKVGDPISSHPKSKYHANYNQLRASGRYPRSRTRDEGVPRAWRKLFAVFSRVPVCECADPS